MLLDVKSDYILSPTNLRRLVRANIHSHVKIINSELPYSSPGHSEPHRPLHPRDCVREGACAMLATLNDCRHDEKKTPRVTAGWKEAHTGG